MPPPIVIPPTLGNSTIKFLEKYQNLLATMQFQQGATLEYWFSRIFPFVEISQRDNEPIGLLLKDDYYTLFDDKERATVFFHIENAIRETQSYSGSFDYDISMIIWYRVPVFSKSRNVKFVLMQELQNKFFRYLGAGEYENLEFITNWEDVWRGFNVDKYFQQSTQPFDCLRINFTTAQTFDCVSLWVSDINDLTIC
jgi:hypothetical protein